MSPLWSNERAHWIWLKCSDLWQLSVSELNEICLGFNCETFKSNSISKRAHLKASMGLATRIDNGTWVKSTASQQPESQTKINEFSSGFMVTQRIKWLELWRLSPHEMCTHRCWCWRTFHNIWIESEKTFLEPFAIHFLWWRKSLWISCSHPIKFSNLLFTQFLVASFIVWINSVSVCSLSFPIFVLVLFRTVVFDIDFLGPHWFCALACSGWSAICYRYVLKTEFITIIEFDKNILIKFRCCWTVK